MSSVKKIVAGAAIAGSLGLGALCGGTAVANADPGWGHGWNGPGWNDGGWHGGGPGWGPPPPPPPPPNYGYGGWNGGWNGGDNCVTGPFGFLRFCN